MSITAAISTFAAFGIQTAAVPTEILSTQSEGFGQPAVLNLDDWMTKLSSTGSFGRLEH
ncbi:hypothetical protein [Lentilactobacillus rapi]|uniref:hypothetical protein n=1 Tax=Lentilactobacillus rapi TaxID=481723 RepID=UPI001FB322BD|nr:hypothetical protein [Lentilactobacillus rapi]